MRRPTVIEVFLIILIGVILAVLLMPVYSMDEHWRPKSNCLSKTKQLALAMLMYANDSDDRYPLAWDWIEGTTPYSKNPDLYTCPTVAEKLHAKYGYAYNSTLSGILQTRIKDPFTTYLVYDSVSLVRDTADPVTSLPAKGRHEGFNNVAFADGHAKSIRASVAP